MANDRRYKRHFIILENEDSGFGKTDKRMPKGYAKIEVRNGKGLLNVYVQDLKYFKDAKYIYRNYLISTKGKKGSYVNTGTFIIDEKGKGELKVKFNPDNVEGSGKPIEDFNIVAVIAQPIERSSVEKEIYGPLVGYTDKQKVSWKNVLAYEENTVKEDPGLDKEYKQKYEEIINVIEKSSKELYKEDKEKTKEYKKEEKEAEKKEDKKYTQNEYKNKHKKYDKDYYEDVKEKDNGVNKDKNKENKEKVKKEINPSENEKGKAKPEVKEKAEVKPEKKEAIKPEKKEAIQPDKKEAIKPEKKEAIKPEKKEAIQPEKEEALKPEKKEAIQPEKKEAIQPEKKEAIKPEKKETMKPEKKEKAKAKVKAEEKKGKMKQEPTKKHTGKKTDVHYKKYHKMVYKYIKDMLKYYEKAQPFEKNIEDYKWWKINYDKKTMHRGFLPFFGYVLSIYSFNPYIYYMNNCQNLMNKYGHYIFGIAYDKDMEPKYYVYGVPGRYLYKDQPFQGMTGFISWYPLEDKNPEKGDYGYWLLHIDAMTGNVVFPMKPTVPPMY